MKNWFDNLSIKSKFIFGIVFLVLFLQLLNSIILVSTRRDEIRENIVYNANNYVRYTSNEVIDYYEQYHDSGYFKLYALIDELLSLNKEIEEIYLIKVDGEVLLSPLNLIMRNPNVSNDFLTDKKLLERVYRNEITSQTIIMEDQEYFDIIFPYLDEWGKHVYSVRYVFSFKTERSTLSNMIGQITIISIFSLLFSVFIIILFTNRITNPIRKLHYFVTKISEGDLTQKLKKQSNDEIGDLFYAVDKMRRDLLKNFDQLLKTQADLKDLNLQLEDKVNERTKQLLTANEALKRLSVTDKLTGLFNRQKIDTELNEALKRYARYSTPFSIIMLDIDHFKRVNDTFGHQAGDKVLCDISKILSHNVRETDVVGRWGGEEFMIICPETMLTQVVQVAEKLRETIELFDFSLSEDITASFGVSSIQKNYSISELTLMADQALYRAKDNGRNRVEFQKELEIQKK